MRLAALALFALSLLACAARPRGDTTESYRAPPPPFEEAVEERAGFVWIPGHYAWNEGRWIWRHGYHEAARPGCLWEAGRWEKRGKMAWFWNDGRWDCRR